MTEVVVIGAGLAGLSCTLSLEASGIPVSLLEASDAPGGRVRTDMVEGFLLDRGFQVLPTAYPEAKRLLDYPALQLKNFRPGALVWHGGRFHRFADPFRNFTGAARFLLDPIVPLTDKLRVATLRAHVLRGNCEELFARPERTTRDYLQAVPFSADIIGRFFEPFFGGVFLANVVPHFVSGVMGKPFQSPFAKPPGRGLSSSTVNVLWGFVNFVVAYLLLMQVGHFDPRSVACVGPFAAGALLISLQSARHFGSLHGGYTP